MPAAAKGRPAHMPRPSSRERARLIGPLIVGPLVCVLALTSLAYLGLIQQAQRDAQAQVSVAASAAHAVLQANMGAVALTNGQLSSALPANVTTLNNNNAEAQRLRAQVGLDTVIAQREQGSFVIVASSLAPAQQGATPTGLGERLSGPLAAQVCGGGASTSAATLTLAGSDYVASGAPLTDGSGACVGAVVALTPISALRQTPLAYTIILAMAGALLALLTVAAGLMLHGRNAAPAASSSERVRLAVAALAEAQAASVMQMEQRQWLARRLSAGRRHMERLMTSLASDRVALQDTTSDIWAGVSHPGAPVDPATAMRLAREGAVVAARIGSRLNDVDAVTADLFADLNTADELDALLDHSLAATEATIVELQALTADSSQGDATDATRRQTIPPHDDYETSVMEAQPRRTAQTPSVASEPVSRQSRGYRIVRPETTGQYRALRPETGQYRAMPPRTGQYPAMTDRGATGKTPAAGQSQSGSGGQQARRPGAQGASGLYRNQGQPGQFGQSGQSGMGSTGRHSAQYPQAPRRTPQPRNNFDTPRPQAPQDGRDRDASGSRWLND